MFLELEEAFSLFDIDGNGLISLNELTAVLKSLGKEYLDEDIKEMMDLADKDGKSNKQSYGSIDQLSNISYDNDVDDGDVVVTVMKTMMIIMIDNDYNNQDNRGDCYGDFVVVVVVDDDDYYYND